MEYSKQNITLQAEDILTYENYLKSQLSNLISFCSGHIFFPRELPHDMRDRNNQYHSIYHPEGKELLIPLVYQNQFLGIFLLQGVVLDDHKSALSWLDKGVKICLENLVLHKSQGLDTLTHLSNKEAFLTFLTEKIEKIIQSIHPSDHVYMPILSNDCNSNFSLIFFAINNFSKINKNYGYSFGDHILRTIACLIKGFCPQYQPIGRFGIDTFILFLSGMGKSRSIDFGERLRTYLLKQRYECPWAWEKIQVPIRMACISYPQDLSGNQLSAKPYEQVHYLLDNGYRALNKVKKQGLSRTLAYSQILQFGGRVKHFFPPNRVLINLGKRDKASEGQLFAIFSSGKKPAPDTSHDWHSDYFKGEIMLTRVYPESSIGELLFLEDPAKKIEKNDILYYLQHKSESKPDQPFSDQTKHNHKTDSHLLPLPLFMQNWQINRRSVDIFSLLICRIKKEGPKLSNKDQSYKLVQDIGHQFQNNLPEDNLMGEYGTRSFILYVPSIDPDKVKKQTKKIYNNLARKDQKSLAIGLAFYPCLNFSKEDTLTNCRKALEHALLLSVPKIAVFNSVSITISADRCFTDNNLTEAIEEYKLALVLNQANTLARNSLGVCYAQLGQLEKALLEFSKVINFESDNFRALYNYGYVNMKLKEYEQAKSCFKNCLQIMPDHLFSLLRLGQIAEEEKNIPLAKDYYSQALSFEHGKKYAYRFLGKVSLEEGRKDQCRDYLHQALVHNPEDSYAMYLLAQLYYMEGENLEIAESLAKKSLSLNPDMDDYANLLKDILAST